MTELLQKAFDKASRLPEEEQNAVAAEWLEELESEQRWQEAFARSPEKLRKMAEQALNEHRQGKTRPLDELLEAEDD